MSRLFTGLVRPFQSRDLAPQKVGAATTPAEDTPKTVTFIWGKTSGSPQFFSAQFSGSVSKYMEKQQREQETDLNKQSG